MNLPGDIRTIVKMQFGAHLYGTATSVSDIDFKGVFLPSKEQVLMGRIPKSYAFTSGTDRSKNTSGDVDCDYYSLQHFIKLACEGQIVAIDMLHAPDDMIIEKSSIWDKIVQERHRFYSKNLSALVSYSRKQAAKYGIKGSRIDSVLKVRSTLESEAPSLRLRDIWNRLPRGEYCVDLGPDPKGIRRYQVCGKTFLESVKLEHVIPVLDRFYEQYGSRARYAAFNRDIDWKALSHAFRAAYQVKGILTERTVAFPLKEAEYLKSVKQGKLDYTSEVAPALESLMDEVAMLAGESSLPEAVDTDYWDKFIFNTLEKELFCIKK